MPRGEKSGNSGVARHRAERVAQAMMRTGASRAAANRIAAALMDREYARVARSQRKHAGVDEGPHDSSTGQRKLQLTTKRGRATTGANKPSAASRSASTKRDVRASGHAGKAATARRPHTAAATRPPRRAGRLTK